MRVQMSSMIPRLEALEARNLELERSLRETSAKVEALEAQLKATHTLAHEARTDAGALRVISSERSAEFIDRLRVLERACLGLRWVGPTLPESEALVDTTNAPDYLQTWYSQHILKSTSFEWDLLINPQPVPPLTE